MNKLNQYRQAEELAKTNRLWLLYGAGFENLGRHGRPITVEMPTPGPDELFICFGSF